jgi:hypothetical protein
MGTSGKYLEDPPSHPSTSRFNVAQVIDSSGLALLTLFEKEHPAVLTKFSLQNMRRELMAAQNRLAALQQKTKNGTALTAAESSELATLQHLSKGSWENFIWGYKPSGQSKGFADAAQDFFSSSNPPKNFDYEFWIHMAVFWLFEKKTKSRSWPETIKAYNGSGQAAEDYKLAVVKRASDAAAAAKGGGSFVPSNI